MISAHTHRPTLVLAVVAAVAAMAAPRAATAQTGDPLIHACYVPSSGTVYRVQAPGTPDACRGKHIGFSWPATGPAGQSCPAGQFVTGFAADGSLLCAAPPAGGGDTGGDSPAAPYFGTWDLEPDISVSCGGIAYVITGVELKGSPSSDLLLQFINSEEFPIIVGADYDAGNDSFHGEFVFDPTHLVVDGQFTSLDAFTMDFAATVDGNPECDIDVAVAGSR